MDKSELVSVPIDTIFASEDTLVDDIRQKLAELLSPMLSNLMPMSILESIGLAPIPQRDGDSSSSIINLNPNRIRIRETCDASPGRLLNTRMTCRQQNLYLSTSRVWTIQILSESESVNDESLYPINEHNDFQVVVMKWLRSSWSLSEKIEYVFRGDLTVEQLCSQLALIYGISSVNHMTMLLLKSYNKMHLSDLNQGTIREIYRSWTCYSHERRKLKDLSNLDFKLRNGDVLLLQDVTEPLKTLTKEDLLSLQYVEEASRSLYGSSYGSGYGANTFRGYDSYNAGYQHPSAYSGVGASSVSTYTDKSDWTSSTNVKARAPNGIKIITQKDRQKQALETSMLSLSMTSVNSDIGVATSQRESSPVTITHESTSSAELMNGKRQGNTDDYEFTKQGGVSIFSDLIDE